MFKSLKQLTLIADKYLQNGRFLITNNTVYSYPHLNLNNLEEKFVTIINFSLSLRINVIKNLIMFKKKSFS